MCVCVNVFVRMIMRILLASVSNNVWDYDYDYEHECLWVYKYEQCSLNMLDYIITYNVMKM